jgi:4-amino-4-deoxy-L-arabinose transferase-like glycosyltransferase
MDKPSPLPLNWWLIGALYAAGLPQVLFFIRPPYRQLLLLALLLGGMLYSTWQAGRLLRFWQTAPRLWLLAAASLSWPIVLGLPSFWSQAWALFLLCLGVYLSFASLPLLRDLWQSYPSPLRWLSLAGGLLCLAILSRRLALEIDFYLVGDLPLLLMLTGACLLPASSWHSWPRLQWRKFAWRGRAGPTLLGLACLFLWAESNAHRLLPAWKLPPEAEFLLLMGGLAGLLYGLGGSLRPGRAQAVSPALILVLWLAFALRIWNLETYPHALIDEIHFIHGVNQIQNPADSDTRLILPFASVTSFPRLFPFMQAQLVDIFSPSLFSLRLLSAILGTLTVAGVYAIGREAWSGRVGLLAAALLATLPPHLFFSRLGLNNIADPALMVWGLAFFLRGLRQGRARPLVLAGLCWGLSHYFYEGGRLFYPALLLAWALVLGLQGRAQWRAWALAGGVAVCVALPFYYTWTSQEATLTPRFQNQRLSFEDWQDRFHAENLWEEIHFYLPFLIYTSLQDGGWFYGGETALLLWPLIPLFVLGVLACAWHWQHPLAPLLLLWLVGTSLANTLLYDPIEVPRYVVSLPALALLMALGAEQAAQWSPSRWQNFILTALIIGSLAYQGRYYFADHLREREENLAYIDLFDVLYRAKDLPPDTEVVIIHPQVFFSYNIVAFQTFYAMPQTVITASPEAYNHETLRTLQPTIPYAFFLDPNDQVTLDRLRYYFNLAEGPTWSHYPVPRDKQLVLYYAPVGSYHYR